MFLKFEQPHEFGVAYIDPAEVSSVVDEEDGAVLTLKGGGGHFLVVVGNADEVMKRIADAMLALSRAA